MKRKKAEKEEVQGHSSTDSFLRQCFLFFILINFILLGFFFGCVAVCSQTK